MKRHPLANLAKAAVSTYIRDNIIIGPPVGLPQRYLIEKAGTFVTIAQNNNLRGCIGTYLPTKENIAQEVIHNAISAATGDPRFGKITREELPSLEYEVYILEKPTQVQNISELNPKIYGIIVIGSDSGRSGLLLPGLKGINDVKQQLSIASDKAGIDLEKETVAIYKFKSEKYR